MTSRIYINITLGYMSYLWVILLLFYVEEINSEYLFIECPYLKDREIVNEKMKPIEEVITKD